MRKNNKMHPRLPKILETIFIILCILFALWGLLSYIEIVCKNLSENVLYSKWNLICLMID